MAPVSSLSRNIIGLVLCALITVPVLLYVSRHIRGWLEGAGLSESTSMVMQAPLQVLLVVLINGAIVFTLYREKAVGFRIAVTCLSCAATTLIYIALITAFFT